MRAITASAAIAHPDANTRVCPIFSLFPLRFHLFPVYMNYMSNLSFHLDRPLRIIGVKGRPITQCSHCRSLRETQSVHTMCKCGSASSNPGKGGGGGERRCRCCHGEECICAPARKQTPSSSVAGSVVGASPSPSPANLIISSSAVSNPGKEGLGATGSHQALKVEEVDESPKSSCCAGSKSEDLPDPPKSSCCAGSKSKNDEPLLPSDNHGLPTSTAKLGGDFTSELPSAVMKYANGDDYWALDMLPPVSESPFVDSNKGRQPEFWELDSLGFDQQA